MSVVKQFRYISIVKLVLYFAMELLWCISENRQENLIFIILMSVLIMSNIIKIVFTAIDVSKIYRTVSLLILWLVELIATTILLTLLFYNIGFDLYDILGIFATFVIITLFIAEVGLFIKFLKSEIK